MKSGTHSTAYFIISPSFTHLV